MRILIVEDEFYTRKALVKIIAEKYPQYESIVEAEDGAVAIKSLMEQSFDIVITDIAMPKVDGLELAERINHDYSDVMIIVISGHSEFEFAQKALRFKVKDYILKPINKKDILDSLSLIIAEIENKKYNDKQQVTKDIDNRQRIEQQIIRSIIQKKSIDNLEGLLNTFNIPSDNKHLKIALIKYKMVVTKSMALELEESLKGKLQIRVFYNFDHRNETLVIFLGSCRLIQFEKDVEDQLNHFLNKYMRLQRGDDYVIGVSRTYHEIESFYGAYNEAKQIQNNYLFLGWGQIFYYRENESSPIRASEDLFYRYENGLKNANEALAVNALEQIFEFLLISIKSSSTGVQWVFMRLDLILSEVIKGDQLQIDTYKEYDQFHMIIEVQAYYLLLTKTICRLVREKDKKTSVIGSLLQYMETNYYEQLSLGTIAKEMYYVNPSYLSRLFSETVGDTFSNKLLSIRMQKAKELIETRKFSVTEVALLVGYNNTSYFIDKFKNYYHQTQIGRAHV